MYSHQGGARPGAPPKMSNRYMKGRLPEGVDFAAYPGRSSTPLPTPESKSAERINQLKIWNEAATNDDKRRLNASKSKAVNVTSAPSARRTDSFKDAKDRHSASFHGAPPPSDKSDPAHMRSAIRTGGLPVPTNKDMFADRSDSESEEDDYPVESPQPPVPMSIPDNVSRVAPSPPKHVTPPTLQPSSPPHRPPPLQQQQPRPEPKVAKACCTIM